MARTKVKASTSSPKRERRPALSPEARESQLISLSMDAAERQIREGTASSQVITHFLKLGSEKERLEREKLKEENKLLKAKTESLEASKVSKQLYEEAIAAMSTYKGLSNNNDGDDYDEYD